MSLERDLRLLAAEVDWPPTPDLAARAGAGEPIRPGIARRPRPAWRRGLVLGLALLLLALAAAFAVPQSRGAILRFLHLGGVTVERVDRLPPARERPLGADLGTVVSLPEAEQALHARLLLPPVDPVPELHLGPSGFVSLLFVDHGEPVQLSELAGADEGIYKKLVAGGTSTTFVDVGGRRGIWIAGARHLVDFPHVPPRLAGNVLVWQRAGLTLRLEGRRLTLKDALGVARSLRAANM